MKKFSENYESIISLENLFTAWEEFIVGKRGKEDVQEFQRHLADNILALHRELKEKTYRHGTYEHFVVTDPKRRDIHKASVRDRLVHHAVHRALYPYLNQRFISDSYSSRVGKGTHKAMDRFRAYAYKASNNHTRTVWVLKCDIKKFFASIDHDVLLTLLAHHVPDKDLLALLENIVRSFSTSHDTGLPLGNLTSQLFANVYMNEFDQFVKHKLKVTYYIRYADDFVFIHHERVWLEEHIPTINTFLNNTLKLTLHSNKVHITTQASGVDYLGWVHFPHHRTIRTVTRRRALKRVGEREQNSMEEEHDAVVNAYLGLLSHGNAWGVEEKIREMRSNN